MKKIKLAVIHTAYVNVPKEAIPDCENFSEESALMYIKSNIDRTLGYIQKAGEANADIVCTNEDFPYHGMYLTDLEHPDVFASLVKTTQTEIREKISALTNKYQMHIAANNYVERDGKIYNTSTLYGRQGEILGKYEKVHMPAIEHWKVSPGEGFDVIETDIGKIGFAICYDMIYPESCRILALNGADIIIHQTQGWGGGGKARSAGESYFRVRAIENSVYLVVAKNNQKSAGERSMVVNNFGEIIAESDVFNDELLIAEFEPNFDMTAPYQFSNYYAGVTGSRARQFLGRIPKLYKAFANEEPTAVKAYKDQQLCDTLEKGRSLMEDWAQKSEEERSLYFW